MTARFESISTIVIFEVVRKKWYHVKRGVPLRIEVGPKEIANNSVFVGRLTRMNLRELDGRIGHKGVWAIRRNPDQSLQPSTNASRFANSGNFKRKQNFASTLMETLVSRFAGLAVRKTSNRFSMNSR